MLDRYLTRHPGERVVVDRMTGLIAGHADCFERTCAPGHITGSCWIVSHDHERFLLTHHRKLGRWLQLGGHADGDPDVARVAFREAREESGMSNFRSFLEEDGRAMPIDVDVHVIPARANEREHEHHDVRFLLVAEADELLRISEESIDLRWFGWSDFDEVVDDTSLGRLGEKASAVLGRHGWTR
jgi:8-oxo-dGTP pyrophosphatase MutT (NUDIX family)